MKDIPKSGKHADFLTWLKRASRPVKPAQNKESTTQAEKSHSKSD